MLYEDLPRHEKTRAILIEKAEFPIVYPFLTPAKIGGVERTEIELTEPTVADLKTARTAKDSIDSTVRLLCCVSDMTEDEAQKLATRDFKRISDTLAPFL